MEGRTNEKVPYGRGPTWARHPVWGCRGEPWGAGSPLPVRGIDLKKFHWDWRGQFLKTRNFDISGRFWAPRAPRDPPGGPPTPPKILKKSKIFGKKFEISKKKFEISNFFDKILHFRAPRAPGDPPGGPPTPPENFEKM